MAISPYLIMMMSFHNLFKTSITLYLCTVKTTHLVPCYYDKSLFNLAICMRPVHTTIFKCFMWRYLITACIICDSWYWIQGITFISLFIVQGINQFFHPEFYHVKNLIVCCYSSPIIAHTMPCLQRINILCTILDYLIRLSFYLHLINCFKSN